MTLLLTKNLYFTKKFLHLTFLVTSYWLSPHLRFLGDRPPIAHASLTADLTEKSVGEHNFQYALQVH